MLRWCLAAVRNHATRVVDVDSSRVPGHARGGWRIDVRLRSISASALKRNPQWEQRKFFW